MRALYFDCFSGASGDMILGALLDLGAPEEDVRSSLDALGLNGWSLDVAQVQRGPLRATRAEVAVDHDGEARTYKEIAALLERSTLAPSVKERALAAFDLLAQAEGRIHGVSPQDVHFHEVGGLDAIVDIVGCCAALETLLPAHVVTSPIATGTGTVATAHGVLPLPAPAVTEILHARGAPLTARGDRELITPTGAVLLAVFTDRFGEMPSLQLDGTGYGAGAVDLEVPNVLRALTGELIEGSSGRSRNAPAADTATLLETNLDDMAPELVPFIVDSLLEAGAYDAWTTPIVMKKGRPGFMLSALLPPAAKWHAMEILFRETTTLGMRVVTVERTIADRHWIEVEVEAHKVRVKIASRHGDVITSSPEYEDVVAAARATGLPLKEVYARAMQAAASATPA